MILEFDRWSFSSILKQKLVKAKLIGIEPIKKWWKLPMKNIKILKI